MRNNKLSQKRLKELIDYDPDTGIFIWKATGIIAGSVKKDTGYRVIRIDGIEYRSGRLVWLYMEGYFPEYEADHKDRIKDNNRWNNIGHKTPMCNSRNRGLRSDNKSMVAGVSWHKRSKKWLVSITISPGNRIYLGYFKDITTGAKVRWEAEKKYNFSNCQTSSSSYLFLKNKGLV